MTISATVESFGLADSLVSIIVPVYRVEQYLDKCVDSIINQTYDNIEVILVNDGSPDRCPQMCEEWAKRDSRIHVINKNNGGLGSARNAGLQVANGDYIWFVDSDDYVEADALEYAVAAAEADQSDIVFFGTQDDAYANGQYRPIVANPMVDFHAATNEEFRAHFAELTEAYWAIPAWNKLYRHAFLTEQHAVFREDINVAEDQQFNIALYPHVRRATAIPRRLYHYVHRGGSLSASRYNSRTLTSRVAVYRTVCSVLTDWSPESLNFYRDELIMQVSVVIDSLYMDINTLTKQKRNHELEQILADDNIREAAVHVKPRSHRNAYISRCLRSGSKNGLKVYGFFVAWFKRHRGR